MAGVLEHITKSSRKLVKDDISAAKVDQKVLELQAAREILAEVFGITLAEINEMLEQRYNDGEKWHASYSCKRQKHLLLDHRRDGSREWPMEFCLE